MTTRAAARHTSHAVAVTAALALLLAACGGTSTTGEGPAVDASGPAAESPTPADPTASDEPGAGDASDDGHMDDAHMDDGHMDGSADDVEADLVVAIEMVDIAFATDDLTFGVGDVVRFDFTNTGAAPHEALIGDLHVQDEHEEAMAAGEGHHDDGHHGDLSMIALEPGESGSFVHEFTEAGEFWLGCHVPGHWNAGMKTRITVTG